MKTTLHLTLLLAACLTVPAFAQDDLQRVELGVSALGAFPSGSSGDGMRQNASFSGGVLASYRFLFTKHHGMEIDYGYTRDTQRFLGLGGVQNAMHEVTASYVYRRPMGRVTPFVLGGIGGVVFNPSLESSSLSAVPGTQAHVAGVYGAGADIALTHHLSFRGEYRGLIYKAPDFGTNFGSSSATHLVEPSGGIVWRF